ncbi:hypothetical protein PILCRDRAFT_234734 [Piloderma croceum F 1598]|uniref:Uncharacterized protein n=1 Tax=Piloderma croceum (strain F 1598) TaxID=765440 RepID=A0A0C3GDF7_PILCF|nr:hypothetical protein PILCRDRAFT_234734 [Piloderma croceum F 1598]
MASPIEEVMVDGYDLQFGMKVIASPPHPYRNCTVFPRSRRTRCHHLIHDTSSRKLHFNPFKDGPARKKIGTNRLYHQSKFGGIIRNWQGAMGIKGFCRLPSILVS